MNILVLSDSFRMGGLENYIITLYQATRETENYFFGFGEYDDVGILKSDHIYTGFHFSFQATVGEMIEDVERLVEIIRKEKIDVIHVHPWYALFAAHFAANLAEVKLVYTFHGTGSLNFTGNLFDQLLAEEIFSTSVSAVFCVNKFGISAFSGIGCGNTFFLPNPVDLKRYDIAEIPGNKKWAFVSRIDRDKYPALEKLIRMLPDLDIEQLDVYGDGECMDRLREAAGSVSARVELKGFEAEIGKAVGGKYDGVIGLGRVAIEAMAMGIPVLFAGLGKVCGLITREDYPKAKQCNFMTYEFREKSADEINQDIRDMYLDKDRYSFPEVVRGDYDVRNLADQYLRVLRNCDHKGGRWFVKSFYQELKKSEECAFFHNSDCTWELAGRFVRPYTLSMHVKTDFLVNERILQMDQIRKNETEGQFDGIRREMAEFSRRLNRLDGEAEALKDSLVREAGKNEENIRSLKAQIRKQLGDISSLAVYRNNMRIVKETIRSRLSKKNGNADMK